MEILALLAIFGWTLVAILFLYTIISFFLNFLVNRKFDKLGVNASNKYKTLSKRQLIILLTGAVDDIIVPKIDLDKSELNAMKIVYNRLLEEEMYKEAKLAHMLLASKLDKLKGFVELADTVKSRNYLKVKEEIETILKDYANFITDINTLSNA